MKKTVKYLVVVLVVMGTLFVGTNMIVDAGQTQQRVNTRILTPPAGGWSWERASHEMGQTHRYNRNGWTGVLPRTAFTINNARATGTFRGTVACFSNCR